MKEIIDYESPNMKILETKISSVLCGSPDGAPATMGWYGDDKDNWE